MATMRNRLSAFFMRSQATGPQHGSPNESSEFETKYARLLQSRDTLKKVESSTRTFMKKAQSLSKAAKSVASAMGTPNDDIKRLTEEMNVGLDDDTLVKAIAAKVLLLDDTVKQKKKLDELKGVRDHHSQRLQQIKTKRAAATVDDVKLHVEEAKWQAKLEHSQKEYDELLQELTEALDFIDAQTRVDGPWSLVGVELEAFRSTQAKMFRSIEGLFVGAPAGSYRRDPAAEQAAVEAQKALETAQQLQESTAGSRQSASVPATASPDKEKKEDPAPNSNSRPKPPKPPGAESDDDDDDDEE